MQCSRKRRALLVFAGILLPLACTPAPKAERHAFFALGTLVEISVYAPPENIEQALREAEDALLAEEHRWRAFESGKLAEINAALSRGNAVAIDADMEKALARAREISVRSQGHFNPAIGNIVRAWGFHAEDRAGAPPPGDDVIARFLPPPQPDALQLQDNGRWKSSDSRLWLDMGAFAKGLAVEIAIATLKEHGVKNAIVNAGGDLKAIGRHGDRRWRIGVRHPRRDGVIAAIDVSDNESVFTSGDYERRFEWNGQRYHHILDPATGQPAREVASVTVIHPDAALADAAATALFVAGPGTWRTIAQNLAVDHVMVVLDDGSIHMTEKMRARLTLEDAAGTAAAVSP